MNGRVLAAGGALAALLALWHGVRPYSGLRYAIGLVGYAPALFAAYLVAQLLEVYHALHGMYLPALGPGLVVVATGALLLIATLFVGIDATERHAEAARLDAWAAALIALSAGAGTIHLAVAAEHFSEFPLYGV